MATSPIGPQLCVQNDVELAIGGVAQLAQLLDKNGDGLADADLVTAIIAHSSAEVLSAVYVQYAPTAVVVPYPDELVYLTATLSAYRAWGFGSSEIVVPDGAQKMADDARRTLDLIRSRQRGIVGISTSPATNQDVVQPNVNPLNDQTTRASTGGVLW